MRRAIRKPDLIELAGDDLQIGARRSLIQPHKLLTRLDLAAVTDRDGRDDAARRMLHLFHFRVDDKAAVYDDGSRKRHKARPAKHDSAGDGENAPSTAQLGAEMVLEMMPQRLNLLAGDKGEVGYFAIEVVSGHEGRVRQRHGGAPLLSQPAWDEAFYPRS